MYKEDYVYVEDKPKKAKNNSAIVLAVCVAASSVFGFAGGYVSDRMSYTQPASTETAAAMGQGTSTHTVIETSAVGTNKSLTDVVAMVKPSVVEITTEVVQTGYRFGQFISEGAGSGVVISDDGYIVTNHHVIDGASNVTVRLSDGSEYPATLVNSDAQTDLAVLKIEATGLTEATLGDSSQLMVGETTVAVGNPLGELGGTVTSGILSALDREISFDGQVMNLLQTDAAINPGNSGGGLFNMKGELIGVVNSKSSGTDIEGLGFAIPINTAKKVMSDIIESGYVKGRVETGLSVVEILDAQTAWMYRVEYAGLYISESTNTQFESGDRIIAIGNVEIASESDYNEALTNYSVGDTVQITVSRGYDTLTIPLLLAEMGV